MRCTAQFDVTRWDDEIYDEPLEGPRMARASVSKVYEGDLRGESASQVLMAQSDPDDYSAGAGYVASERITGQLGDRKGSFVIQYGGTTGGGADEKSFGHVVPGSGRGDFEGMHGSVEIGKNAEGKHMLTMEFDFG